MKNLNIQLEEKDHALNIKLDGHLTLMDALDFKAFLPKKAIGFTEVLIDLSGVSDVDLTGLNALLISKLQLEKNQCSLALIAAKDHPIFQLLHLTKFTNQFTFQA